MLTYNTHLSAGSILTPIVKAVEARHMSRYPIVVEVEDDHVVHFHDSRCNGEDDSNYRVASLSVSEDKNKYTVWSKRITNRRYAQWGEARHTISSIKVDKIIDKLLEVLTSFTEIELATRSYRLVDVKFDDWLRESKNAYGDLHPQYMRAAEIIEALIEDYMAASNGAAPYTNATLQRYFRPEFVAAYKENRDRLDTKRPNINVFINPDGLVHMVRNKKEESTEPENYELVGKFNSYDEVPQGMREACSMLKLVEGGTYVQNVGYKHPTHNSFWIYE